jgi:hypothetical protein
MESTNSVYFEHKGVKYAASVQEDITTDPKTILITPTGLTEIGNEIRFELVTGEWIGPKSLKREFSDTYESILKAIKVAGYVP